MYLEASSSAAIVIASRQGGVEGIGFSEFLQNLCFEVQALCSHESVLPLSSFKISGVPQCLQNCIVPFLSVCNQIWPDYLMDSTEFKLANCRRTVNKERIDFSTGKTKDPRPAKFSSILDQISVQLGETIDVINCSPEDQKHMSEEEEIDVINDSPEDEKDQVAILDPLTQTKTEFSAEMKSEAILSLNSLRKILRNVPRLSRFHLVFAEKMQDSYFNKGTYNEYVAGIKAKEKNKGREIDMDFHVCRLARQNGTPDHIHFKPVDGIPVAPDSKRCVIFIPLNV
jgi:hypothetical protein